MNTDAIFNIQTNAEFEALAFEIFRHQFEHNTTYRSFCDLLYKHPSDINSLEDIPFLPIEFFKSRKVVSMETPIEEIFTSSGTTGSIPSKHYVADLKVYEKSFRKGFAHFYGNMEDFVVLALLPNYLERKGSSLVYMANDLIQRSKQPESGFYLHNLDQLATELQSLDASGKKVLLIGVSFALLDLIENNSFQLNNTIIMETGGMKGRRKEMIRTELHEVLKKGFGVSEIHSEYGMTELLSQAYATGNGRFQSPPWMQIFTRDTEDPLSAQSYGKTGGINVIDLANVHSCAFIATQDLGKKFKDNSFEILGRFDHSDIRGCNLMVF